ncbi:hypothetical protein JW805_04380 [Roseomonas aeriglobus]|nr:hypothetical protein [Roseomonas aeriglobus]
MGGDPGGTERPPGDLGDIGQISILCALLIILATLGLPFRRGDHRAARIAVEAIVTPSDQTGPVTTRRGFETCDPVKAHGRHSHAIEDEVQQAAANNRPRHLQQPDDG